MSKSTIVYLTSTSLSVQTEKSVLKTITFPEELGKQSSATAEMLENFFENQLSPLRKKLQIVVIVLGSGVLFQQVVEKGEDTQEAQDALLTKVSFSKSDLIEKTIDTKAKTYILATSSSVTKALVSALRNSEVDIEAIVPISLFTDNLPTDTLDKSDVKAILEGENIFTVGDFLSDIEEVSPLERMEQEEVAKPAETKEEAPLPVAATGYITEVKWNTPRLLIILGFLVILTILMGSLLFIQHQRLETMKAEITPTQAVTPTPTEVPEVSKAELTVSVMNGTGTPGQAGKVKSLVTGAGYEKVETGNADTTDHDKTEVVFSDKVSQKQQDELKELLEKSFTEVTTKVESGAATDIVITTGTEK